MGRTKRASKRKLGRVLRVFGVAVIVWIAWAGLDFAYVSIGVEEDHAAPADAIIVLGCPSYEGNIPAATFSACVQVRAHHAADLYKRGLAPHIIATGGLTGPPPSEAEAMAQVMEADGVPREAIIVEDRARDTVQNIRNSREVMQARGWGTAILVTEPHHIRRAAVIAGDAGLAVFPSPALASPSWHTPRARLQNLMLNAQFLMTYQLNRLLGQRV